MRRKTEQNGKMALLDILLQSTTADGQFLSNEDISEEVDTFMFEVSVTKQNLFTVIELSI